MSRLQSILTILKVVFLLALAWGGITISRLLLVEPENQNKNFISDDLEWVVQLDGMELLKTGFYDALIHSNDEEFLSLLQDVLEKRKDQESVNTGIDFLSNTYIGKVKSKHDIFVAYVNLNRPEKFKEFTESIRSMNIVCAQKNKVGLIIYSTDDLKKSGLNPSTLFNNSSNYSKKFNQSELIQLEINKDDFTGNAQFKSDQSEMNIEGLFFFPEQDAEKERLKPDGLHITASIPGAAINDSVQELLNRFIPGIEAKISSLSMNYRGIDLTEDKKIMFLPDADFLLGFDREQNIHEILIEQDSLGRIELLGPSTFMCAGKLFMYMQLDESHIYFGRNPMETVSNEEHHLFISGSPSVITKMSGNTMMQRLIKMFPSYRASEDLFDSMKSIEIQMLHGDKGEKLKGKIEFTEGNPPTPTILKFLLRTRLID